MLQELMRTGMVKGENLELTINQVSSAAIFWTLSRAEFHWPEFHSLLSDCEVSNIETLRESIINNPHLLDWFFTVRVEKFVKHWLYEQMGGEWHWYRFEFVVM